MSNKTQLQTNNSALDALIVRVNAAKDTAASLPEASGSSGSGESVETCNVQLLIDCPAGGVPFYYVNSSSELCQSAFPVSMKEGPNIISNVQKGSIAFADESYGQFGISGDGTLINTSHGTLFFINGEYSITYLG